ncbi:CDP-diacylglycerol--glycerol-3-phosphate 3-phosphatidyltransferase [Paenibacillus sp. PvP094]|uniref:CDP-diacylglycerol--glycerol-3-phosphate 3-phosphatidyltransferase n=1 Tax=Paenibacillus sp. PvP094 TaxID=3156394 RepID=UPI00339935CB
MKGVDMLNWANRITLARMALIPLFMLCFVPLSPSILGQSEILQIMNQHGTTFGVIIFIIAAGTDKLDGYIARKYNQVTNLGKLLDPLADKLLISVALLVMVQENMIGSWIAVIIIGREILITAIRMVRNRTGHCSRSRSVWQTQNGAAGCCNHSNIAGQLSISPADGYPGGHGSTVGGSRHYTLLRDELHSNEL